MMRSVLRIGTAIVGAATMAAIAACGSTQLPPAGSTARLYIVGIDMSSSRTPAQLQDGRQLLDGVIGRMMNGDELVFIESYRAGTDSAVQWHRQVPPARVPGHPTGGEQKKAEQFRHAATAVAASLFDQSSSQRIMTTDLLSTLSRAADYAKAAQGRSTTLILLSDMLNSTPELNMERKGGVPPQSWITERKSQGRLPDLRGVCTVIVGADVSSVHGMATRAFWKQYFAAVGAKLPDANYRNMIVDPAEASCP